MRPISVEFSAFGSYPDTVSVDFTTLAARGLFVVTGDTGTGKTTIFDAMSFALFGKMASKDSNDIRSHHAKPDAETWARFTFEINGVRYVADRSPAYERASRRGGGTAKQTAKASLVRQNPDGSSQAIATASREMDKVIAELVGLTAEQFRRVMVLPQGEVTKFLMDDSGNRESLLAALFGGEVYDRIARVLEDEAKALKLDVGNTDEELRHQLKNAINGLTRLHELLGIGVPDLDGHPREGLDVLLTPLQPTIATLESDAKNARAQAETAARLRDDADAAAQRFDQANAQRATIAKITGTLPNAKAGAEAAETSQRARPVVVADTQLQEATSREADAQRGLDERREAITAASTTAGIPLDNLSPVALTSTLSDINGQITSGRELIAAVGTAAAAVERAAQNLAQNESERSALETKVNELTATRDELDEQLSAFADTPDDTSAIDREHGDLKTVRSKIGTRNDLTTQLARQDEAVRRATDDFETMLERYVATEAPRLAERLTPGEPCAVCGSLEHPAPAVADGGEIVTIDDVDAARSRRDSATEQQSQIQRSLDTVTAELGESATATVDQINEQIEQNREAAQAITLAIAERNRLSSQRDTLADELKKAQDGAIRLDGARPQLEAAHKDAITAHDEAVERASSVNPDQLDILDGFCNTLAPLVKGLDAIESKLTTAQADRATAQRQLDEALATSGFNSVDDARAVVIDQAAEKAALEALQRLEQDLLTASTKLKTLEEQGLPDKRPDTEALTRAALEASTASQSLVEQLTNVKTAHTSTVKALAAHDKLDAGSAALRARAEAAQRASTVCRGQGTVKVSLRRWVLGRELDRVTEVASVHLAQMTGGRYTLRRMEDVSGKQGAKGLDLEVLDAHTGRPRKPNSLSGGEQFQASLALALGVADVVSQGGSGSGQRIEALFVDEGFGSLDPRALDDAIETLHQLHASGRMVGAITHVEAMKERLHPGIVVTRLPDGRGSTLTVNP